MRPGGNTVFPAHDLSVNTVFRERSFPITQFPDNPVTPVGTRFADLLAAVVRSAPKIVIVEGGRTTDGTHPNLAGSVALGERVIEEIGPRLPWRTDRSDDVEAHAAICHNLVTLSGW